MFPGGFPGAFGNPHGYSAMNDGYATFDAGGPAQNHAWQQQRQQMSNTYGMYNSVTQWQDPVEQYNWNNPGQTRYPYDGAGDSMTNEAGVDGERDLRLEDLDEAQLQALPIEQLRRLDQQLVQASAVGPLVQPQPLTHDQQPQLGFNITSESTAIGAPTISNPLEKAAVPDRAAELRAKLIADKSRSNTPDNRGSATTVHTTGQAMRPAPLISSTTPPGEADRIGPPQGTIMAADLDGLITEGKAAADAIAKRSSLTTNATNQVDRKATDSRTKEPYTSKANVPIVNLPKKQVQKPSEHVESIFKDNRQDSLSINTPLSSRSSRPSERSVKSGEIEKPPQPTTQGKSGHDVLYSKQLAAKDPGRPLATALISRPTSGLRANDGENNNTDYARGSRSSQDLSNQRNHENNGGGREYGNTTTGLGSLPNRPPPVKPKPREPAVLPEKRSFKVHPNKANEQAGKKSTSTSESTHKNPQSPREADRPSFNPPPEDAAVRYEDDPELVDWLELTGFYNLAYREKKLKNYRRQQQINRLQQELEEEEEELEMAHKPTLRAASVRPSGLTSRAGSAAAMPPPPRPSIDAKLTDHVLSPDVIYDEDISPKISSRKRVASPPDGPGNDAGHAKKKMRLDTTAGAENPNGANDREIQSSSRDSAPNSATSWRVDDGPLGLRVKGAVDDDQRRRSSLSIKSEPRSRPKSPLPLSERISKADGPGSRKHRPITDRSLPPYYAEGGDRARYQRPRSASPGDYRIRNWHDREGYDYYKPDYYDGNAYSDRRSSHDQGHYDGGRGSDRGGRGGYRGGYGSNKRGATTESKGSSSLNLRAGDTRYFMIKSWNHENVQIAQQESVWATQTRNEGILTEAYKTCRQVILLFSVNKSMAFQGYALMASAPGTATLPVWVTSLNWPTSGAFEIRWIAITDTPFRRVGHLKNSLNEGLAVPVGRDGQEIEAAAGQEVCEIVDEVGMEWY